MISIIVIILVFILIAVRQIGRVRFQIWQVMLLGAIVVLLSGQISPLDAAKAINLDVIIFLFGMFIVGRALEESGYLSVVALKYFRRAKSLGNAVIFILIGFGLLSVFLMNDTVAIIGTPLILILAKNRSKQAKIMLLSLAFAITIGSVTSPIGNPQNLLIAIGSQLTSPFITFFIHLFLPTVINLFLAYLLLRLFYRKELDSPVDFLNQLPQIQDKKLTLYVRLALILLVAMIMAKIITVSIGASIDFKLTYIALVAAFPIVLMSRRRFEIIKKIDWFTLVFFASMFVLTQSVWNSGIFQLVIKDISNNLASAGSIFGVSVIISQFISNVPLVALYLPVLTQAGIQAKGLMMLAAGSTIAGNLSILGAASNVIIIQNAEKRSDISLSFFEFVRIGAPLTVVNGLVYWIFLTVMP